jgi:uncharacterized membrane protein
MTDSPNIAAPKPALPLWMRGMLSIVLMLYPFLVYFGLQQFSPRVLAVFIIAILLLRISVDRQSNRNMVWPLFAAVALCVVALWFNNSQLLQWYPVVLSSAFLVLFFSSLFYGTPMVERIARAIDGELTARDIIYTRRVTQIWCVFFVFNAVVAAVTTQLSNEIWVLYNGLLSYLLMGSLLMIERIGRQRFKQWVKVAA